MENFTLREWRAEGERRFGSDPNNWKFRCPSCGNVQTIRDFEGLDLGQTKAEDVVYFSCIGRWNGSGDVEMCSGKSPCNYTIGGLFVLSETQIELDEKTMAVFDFADVDES